MLFVLPSNNEEIGMSSDLLGVQAMEAQLIAMQLQVERAKKEVEQANLFLDQASRDLRTQLLSSVKVLSSVLELRSVPLAQHCRRVAELSRFLGKELGCTDTEVLQIYIAATLHDLGKLGWSDTDLSLPSAEDGGFKVEWNKHPTKGHAVLSGLHDLHVPARYIRHHHERFDGQGVPDGLRGDEIPLGARIIAVAEDYDELQLGWVTKKRFEDDEALLFIQGAAGKRYDPAVVDVLPKALERLRAHPHEDEVILRVADVQVGMKISRDLVGPDGVLLMARDRMVTSTLIQRLQEFKLKGHGDTKVYLYKNTVPQKNLV
jgi:response regulator RpfG family c-di-GMP phosphodiesterase